MKMTSGKWIAIALGALWIGGIAINESMRPIFTSGKVLLKASEAGDEAQVERLLKKHTSTMLRNSDGHSALWLAANKGFTSIVERLLKSGADPNTIGHEGWSPLMAASYNGHFDVVKLLIAYKANPAARDIGNMTAADYAKDYPEIVAYINTAVAKSNLVK